MAHHSRRPRDRAAELFGGLEAIGWRFGQRPLENPLAPIGQPFAVQMKRRWRIRDLFLNHPDGGVRLEGQRAGQQPVEHDADRVQIGPAIDFVAEHLLGRHVGRRAHHEPVVRQVFGAADAGDAEVHDLDAAVLGDHHVRRLHVAMDDAGAMRVLERGEDAVDERRRAIGLQRSRTFGQLVERLAANKLHDHQQIRVRSEQLVDGRDFWMVQLGERGRFCPEPFHDVRVGELRVEHFDRDLAIERLVDSFVDGAHAAAPKLSDNAIFADGLANHEGSTSTRISAPKDSPKFCRISN